MTSTDKAPGPTTHTVPQQRQWALVTGASGGIGQEFARYLAAHGCDLIITGRRRDKLESLREQLETDGARVRITTADLGSREAREQLVAELDTDGIEVATLVNNAGYGIIGDVADNDVYALLGMLDVNVSALTHLTRLLLPGMLQRRQGTIINVASTASFQPIPAMAAYAASKAYVRSFSTALSQEVAGTGVRVVCISPGPTESGFFEVAGDADAMARRRTPADVVATTFAALRRGQASIVDGPANQVMAFSNRFVPDALSGRIARRIVGH